MRPPDYLLELPMLSAYLDAGLAAFDLSCDGRGRWSSLPGGREDYPRVIFAMNASRLA